MTWNMNFSKKLKGSYRKTGSFHITAQVVKRIEKVEKSSTDKGGYGKPLGNKNGINLTNLLK